MNAGRVVLDVTTGERVRWLRELDNGMVLVSPVYAPGTYRHLAPDEILEISE